MVRGEVFRLRSPCERRDSDQAGERFGVIVQSDDLLALSTVFVAPTSRSAPARSFRPEIDIAGEATRVLVEQTTAIAPERLGDSAGRLSSRELGDLDEALAMVFGL